MLTKWQQVEDWIRGNNLEHWIFSQNSRSAIKEGASPNDKIVDSDCYGTDKEEKIAMTKKMLEMYSCRCYGTGWVGKKVTDGFFCEVQIQEVTMPSIGSTPAVMMEPSFDRESFAKEIRQQVMSEIATQRLEEDRKNFEKEKKAFEQEKSSAMGMLVGYLAPLAQVLKPAPRVAGIDAPHNVPVAQFVPAEEEHASAEGKEESPFTDEEADKLFDLMARFKAVEPQYMQLIEAVVTMAESGDQTYTMAKGFLIK